MSQIECCECKNELPEDMAYRKAIALRDEKGNLIYLCFNCNPYGLWQDSRMLGKYQEIYNKWFKSINPSVSEREWTVYTVCPAEEDLFIDSRHKRKDFMFKGEGWGCIGTNSAYDTLSGSSSSQCEKRGEIHFRLNWGTGYGLSGHSWMGTRCGIVCNKHFKPYSMVNGTTTLKLFNS